MVMKLVLEKLTGQEVVTPQPDSKWKRIYNLEFFLKIFPR